MVPFAIGNRVFSDINGNGKLDGLDAGIDGVILELWRDLDGNGLFAPAAGDLQTPLTTVTASGGYFYFDNLGTGSYFVRATAANFQTGQPLAGRHSSMGNGTGSADETQDENGIDSGTPQTTGITSGLIPLTIGGAPTGETSAHYAGTVPDANANFTVDFGFQNLQPTLALLASLQAYVENGQAVVAWEDRIRARDSVL